MSTREYSPDELQAFEAKRAFHSGRAGQAVATAKYRNSGIAWTVAGGVLLAWIARGGLDKQLYILAFGGITFGLIQIVCGLLQSRGKTDNGLCSIVSDLFHMPRVMRQLAVVQFFRGLPCSPCGSTAPRP